MPTFSFQNPLPTLAFTKPKALRLGSATYETPAWAKVLEKAARAMLDGAPTRKAALAAAKRFPWMGRSGRGMTLPGELEPGVWIELHQNSYTILIRMKMLFEYCGYPLDQASLEYETTSHEVSVPQHDGANSPNVPETPHATSVMPDKAATATYVQQTLPGLPSARKKKSKQEPYTAYPKRELFTALAEDRIPDEDFDRLLTLEGTRAILGMTPRHDTPVFSLSPRQFFWRDAATRRGCPVFVTGQWFKRDKARLDRMLARWRGLSSKPEKIGAYAKRMLFQALAEKGRIPDEDFTSLQSMEGTKALLGISLTTCPLFSLSPMVRRDGGRGSWIDPATRNGKPVYVNSQWYEEYREKLDRLLARWHLVDSADRPRAVKHLSSRKESGMIPETEKNLAELLEAEFPNGVRPGDFIDQRKLRKFYKEYFETELPADFPFTKVLPCLGIVHDGKVFPRPSEKGGGWRTIIDGLAAQGHRLFQFSRVMQRHAKELMHLGITSPEMLRKVMSKSASDAYEIKDGFFIAKAVPPRDLIPADAVLVEEKDLAKAFPYVDEEEIRNFLRNVPGTIRNGPGSWAVSDRIAFDEDEMAAGRAECSTAVANDGFFSLAQLQLENSAAMNDHRLADGTLRRTFFQRFLSEEFDLAGQIVHAKGSAVDAAVPLRLFLRNRAETTLAEIEDLAREYNIFISKALETALEETVRVSRDRFVSPRLVAFDGAAVDEAVAARCVGGATPLCEFSGFADFPAVPGFVWNDFLLESFLRRESRRFRLFSASSAAKDASGAVAEKSAPFADAPSAFAAAALAGAVDPEPEAVGDFLVASRCALRRGRELVAAVVSAMHSQKRNRK